MLAALVRDPHWEQKRAVGLTSVPHDVHLLASGDPHSEQNFAWGPLSAPHAWQCTAA
jgi:hypothetical protein